MKILVNFPSRNRPYKLISILNQLILLAGDLTKIHFHLSLDSNDESMNNDQMIKTLKGYSEKYPISYNFDTSTNKINAINRDMKVVSKMYDWNILMLMSDDMVPQVQGWDTLIREAMILNFPDTDGALHFFDGFRNDLITLPIMGKKYYKRFNYIYSPAYESFWTDNEMTLVAYGLKKAVFIDTCIVKHMHPAWIGMDAWDKLYESNQEAYERDEKVFNDRKNIISIYRSN